LWRPPRKHDFGNDLSEILFEVPGNTTEFRLSKGFHECIHAQIAPNHQNTALTLPGRWRLEIGIAFLVAAVRQPHFDIERHDLEYRGWIG
jgi:hypothetical protein